MESINGITFENWAAACGNLAQGMPETQMLEVLGIEKPIWDDTNEKWTNQLGDLMTADINFANKYGEIFAQPKVGKFASADTPASGIEALLQIVPDFDSYQKIFWQQSVASKHGVDPTSVIEAYGLDIGKWGTLNMHYMNQGFNGLDPEDPDYNEKSTEIRRIMTKWENHWKEHYAEDATNLSDDIDF